MTILVTGTAGFIGSHVTEQLLKEGHTVIGVDNFNDYYDPKIKRSNISSFATNKNFILVESDIRDQSAIDMVFKKHPIECVVHLAARAGVRPSLEDPKLYWDVNIMGSLNILQTMVTHNVNQLVFASSSSVYGNRDQGPFKETDNTDFQVSPYGASKKALEVLTATYAHLHGIKTTGLRFFTVYGPRNRQDMACYLFMDAIAKGEELTMFGDGTTGRDYTYIEDIVAGIISAINNPQPYEIINLGNSSPLLLKDMITTIEKVVGKKANIIQKPMPTGDVKFTYADTSKAKELLNWDAKTDFETGIENLWEWYRKTT